MARSTKLPRDKAIVERDPVPAITNGKKVNSLMFCIGHRAEYELDWWEIKIREFNETLAKNGITYAMEWKGPDAMIAEWMIRKYGKALRIIQGKESMPETATVTIEEYLRNEVRDLERDLLENGHALNQSTCPVRNLSNHCEHQAKIRSRKLFQNLLELWDQMKAVAALPPDEIYAG